MLYFWRSSFYVEYAHTCLECIKDAVQIIDRKIEERENTSVRGRAHTPIKVSCFNDEG